MASGVNGNDQTFTLWRCPLHGLGVAAGTNMARPPFDPDKTYCLGGHSREDPQEVEATVTVTVAELADELTRRLVEPGFDTRAVLVDAALAIEAR